MRRFLSFLMVSTILLAGLARPLLARWRRLDDWRSGRLASGWDYVMRRGRLKHLVQRLLFRRYAAPVGTRQ